MSDVQRMLTGLVLVSVSAIFPAVAFAHGQDADLPVSHFPGGGSAATDCLGGLEAVGLDLGERARGVTCRDGDPACDRDHLVNGRCEFWIRACLNTSGADCQARDGVTTIAVDNAASDPDLTTLSRTLELVALPTSDVDRCGALTRLRVALGTRKNGSARKARTTVELKVAGVGGLQDDDKVKFICKPPAKAKRGSGISFGRIQHTIFERQCAFSGCHSFDSAESGLVLEGPNVYDALINVSATTSAAAFAGKKRVIPGLPSSSFLLDKVVGALGPGEGDRMPLGRGSLRADEIEALRKWILAGAPREGSVGRGLVGDLDEQPRIEPPAIPVGGFQAHMAPFSLGDLDEKEGCILMRLDNPEPISVGAWEVFMHEGSHHVIIQTWPCGDDDADGTNDCDEPDFDAQFPTDFVPCEQFGYNWAFVIGAQTPHLRLDYQTASTGVALPLHRYQPVLINSHYTNPFSDTMAEVWVNAETVDPAIVRHPARLLFEQIANAFIKVPPGERSSLATSLTCAFADDFFCEFAGEPAPAADAFALLAVTSHRHNRSIKFVTDLFQDGAKLSRGPEDMIDRDDGSSHLYVSTDYADPVNLTFWPPILVERGDELTYTCLHDNGITRPVRLGCEEVAGEIPGKSVLDLLGELDGASRICSSDADCDGFGTGRCVPANLVFGYLSQDEMCVTLGLYYPCDGDTSTCLD